MKTFAACLVAIITIVAVRWLSGEQKDITDTVMLMTIFMIYLRLDWFEKEINNKL